MLRKYMRLFVLFLGELTWVSSIYANQTTPTDIYTLFAEAQSNQRNGERDQRV